MNDFKPKEHEKHQDEQKELLPPNTNEKPKQKPRRKPGPDASPNQGGNAASSEESMKQSRHNRSKQGSMDSSNDQDPSVRRRCSGGNSVKDREASTNHILLGFGIVKSHFSSNCSNTNCWNCYDGSAPPRKAASRPRKLKRSIGRQASLKKSSKVKPPESSVDDTSNDII
ncbi:hypothetical protein F2Q69_00001576 [Brassica cretica]|uniref:Uncharacterized protein n=1 Tax=Brassica cretica TaxID=69181 RepID=A0A8S9PCH0_BRACR|nr:hypothetical protein F2Q69_00001576 [Brassica cretica]